MKTRLIAGIIAVVLAIVGTVVLVGYVRGADARAMAGLDTVQVLVAAEPIPQGAQAADVAKLAALKTLPATAVLPDRITGLDQIAGQVALVALEPGEQLLAGKFGPLPSDAPKELVIPPSMQRVTVLLDLAQALGGQVEAGDTVGVFLSVTESKQTHFVAHKVLVTLVQSEASGTTGTATAEPGKAAGAAPADLEAKLLITLATTAPIAERIVFAANFGTVWLSDEPQSADESGTQTIDGTTVSK